jgi:hypothetical protein
VNRVQQYVALRWRRQWPGWWATSENQQRDVHTHPSDDHDLAQDPFVDVLARDKRDHRDAAFRMRAHRFRSARALKAALREVRKKP